MNDLSLNLSRNKKLALTGAFSALVVVLGITNLGLIPIGATASITILQIPVILIGWHMLRSSLVFVHRMNLITVLYMLRNSAKVLT